MKYILFMAVLLANGDTASPAPLVFETRDECEATKFMVQAMPMPEIIVRQTGTTGTVVGRKLWCLPIGLGVAA